MTASTTTIPKTRSGAGTPAPLSIKAPLAVVEVKAGWLCAKNASGYATPATSTAMGGLVCFGVSTGSFDNTGGSAGDIVAQFEQGVFEFENSSSSDELTIADVGNVVFAVDNMTVAKTSNAAVRAMAGRLVGFSEAAKPLVLVGVALGGVASVKKAICFSLHDWREVSSGGDPGAIAANGGILASDTTPILRGDAAESSEIAWAAANADPISTQITLPLDFDDTKDAVFEAFVYTDNAGGGGIEAASFTLETGWDGGALVSDALTDTTPAVTWHKVSATIAAADIPAGAANLTIALTPGTHANDPIQLVGARLVYEPKLAS